MSHAPSAPAAAMAYNLTHLTESGMLLAMNRRIGSSFLALCLLNACATQDGQVRPIAPDTYEVGYYAGLKPLSWVEIKNRTLERADAYCAAMDRRMVNPVVTSNKATGLIPKEASTRFRCVPKDQDITSAS